MHFYFAFLWTYRSVYPRRHSVRQRVIKQHRPQNLRCIGPYRRHVPRIQTINKRNDDPA